MRNSCYIHTHPATRCLGYSNYTYNQMRSSYIFYNIGIFHLWQKKLTPPHFNPPQKVLHTYWGGLLIN